MKAMFLLAVFGVYAATFQHAHAEDLTYVLKRRTAIAGSKTSSKPVCLAKSKLRSENGLTRLVVRSGDSISRFTTVEPFKIRETVKNFKTKSKCQFIYVAKINPEASHWQNFMRLGNR